MRTIKEIRECRKDVKIGMRDCIEPDSLVYQGWAEALTWVLKKKPLTSAEKGLERQIKKIEKAVWTDQYYGNGLQKLNGADVKVEIDEDRFIDFINEHEDCKDPDDELEIYVTLIFENGERTETDGVYYKRTFIEEKMDGRRRKRKN